MEHSAGESDDGLQYGQAHPQKAGQMGNVGITRRAKLIAVCCIAMVAGFAVQTSAQEKQALRLVRTIPLPGVTGRLDHMGVDLEKKRLFVAASANNTLEVVDLTGGKVINTLTGFKDPQDALFLGGDFNKLYVSSLDGHVRVFQGETFRPVRDFKIEPGPNRLFYDPTTNLIYFGYGGQNAGFDAYERVGILQPKRGAGDDQLVADMIAPTPRPGHLAEIAMDDNGTLLVCDSRENLIYQFDTRKRELIKSWFARGDGAADMALDRSRHRLFVGMRNPPEMTVYDSLSGEEIQSLPAPETMDGVYYDAKLKRVYVTGGRWYGTLQASLGWIYVYQQKDPDHYDVISKIQTRPGSGTSLLVPQFNTLYVASQAIGDQEAAILVFEPVP
jgi:DNA-binding beta-propeller fold protein YncE